MTGEGKYTCIHCVPIFLCLDELSVLVSWKSLLLASLPSACFSHSCWLLFSASEFSLHFTLAMQRCESLWLNSVNWAPQIGPLDTLCLGRDSPCHNGHAAYALCEVKKTVWKTERLDLVFCLSFNMGCDFVRRIFLDLWSVSQGSFALEFEMEFEIHWV